MDFSKFSYQRLKKLPSISTIDEAHEVEAEQQQVVNKVRSMTKKKRRAVRVGRRWWIRKPKIRIRGLATAMRRVVRKVVKRMKEGTPYIGELFAGNYLMFMQVSPSSLELPIKNYAASFDYCYKPYLRGAGSDCYYPAVRSLQLQT